MAVASKQSQIVCSGKELGMNVHRLACGKGGKGHLVSEGGEGVQ